MEPSAGYLSWPTRFPIWRVGALVVGIGLTYTSITEWTTADIGALSHHRGLGWLVKPDGRTRLGLSTLERFYWSEYASLSRKDMLPKIKMPALPMFGRAAQLETVQMHEVITINGRLATPTTFGRGWKYARWAMENGPYVAMLRQFIFGGEGVLRVLRIPLWTGVGLTLLLLGLGSRKDINLRRQAAAGIHRRGTKIITTEQFNRKSLGWWPVR